MKNLQKTPFFFIIGRPRSGTTLLRTLLDAHPNIIVPPEYPVILDLFNKYGKVQFWDKDLLDAFYQDFKRTQPKEFWKYEYLKIDESALERTLDKISGNEAAFSLILKAFYLHSGSLYGKKDIRLIGDKNPIYASFTHRLLKIFPDAKFIYLTRDYRDNYTSIRKFNFEAHNVALQTYRWKYATRKFLALAEHNPGQFVHLRYEDLVSDPKKELTSICGFLGIHYDPVMLSFYEKAGEAKKIVGEENFNKFHKGLTRPIHNSNLFGWKSALTETEIELADATVGEFGEMMGYEPQVTDINLRTKLAILPWRIYGNVLYKVMDAAEHMPSGVRRRAAALLPFLAKMYHYFAGNGSSSNI